MAAVGGALFSFGKLSVPPSFIMLQVYVEESRLGFKSQKVKKNSWQGKKKSLWINYS